MCKDKIKVRKIEVHLNHTKNYIPIYKFPRLESGWILNISTVDETSIPYYKTFCHFFDKDLDKVLEKLDQEIKRLEIV